VASSNTRVLLVVFQRAQDSHSPIGLTGRGALRDMSQNASQKGELGVHLYLKCTRILALAAPKYAMPSVQIKRCAGGHRVLRERAARAHLSLQEYLRSRLIADASQPTLEEVFERRGT